MTTVVNIDFPTEQEEGAYSIEDGLIYFFFGTGVSIYYSLPGVDNNFNAIWTDTNTSSAKGRVYIATNNSLIVIDTASKTVTDYYTRTDKGRSGEVLTNDEIVDINKVNRGS